MNLKQIIVSLRAYLQFSATCVYRLLKDGNYIRSLRQFVPDFLTEVLEYLGPVFQVYGALEYFSSWCSC